MSLHNFYNVLTLGREESGFGCGGLHPFPPSKQDTRNPPYLVLETLSGPRHGSQKEPRASCCLLNQTAFPAQGQ